MRTLKLLVVASAITHAKKRNDQKRCGLTLLDLKLAGQVYSSKAL